MSTLYITATPIGNLEDITLRALRILKEVDMILCEDTRVTRNLLKHYEIETPTMSYHAQSNELKHQQILDLLESGKNLALVSDAGTPTISDPGVLLVQMVARELEEVEIVAVPGASALTATLSISGISSATFTFLGFLPHKKGRATKFAEIEQTKHAVAFYESPHRIMKTLTSLAELMPERMIVIGREITKMYEQRIEKTAIKMLEYFTENPDKVRGEFVVIVAPEKK